MSEQPHLYRETTGEWLDPTSRAPAPGRRSVWAGWIAFAGMMMVMVGVFNAIEGLAGILVNDFYVAAPENVLVLDLTAWGWLNLVGGILLALTGTALLIGAAWARVVAVILMILNAIAQLAFAAVYPVWSLIVIGLSVVAIWAIVVHGDEAAEDM